MSSILKEIYLDKKYEKASWREAANAQVTAISGIGEQDVKDLRNAFGINTVAELAHNAYVLTAQGINAFSKVSEKILDKNFESTEYEELRKKTSDLNIWNI